MTGQDRNIQPQQNARAWVRFMRSISQVRNSVSSHKTPFGLALGLGFLILPLSALAFNTGISKNDSVTSVSGSDASDSSEIEQKELNVPKLEESATAAEPSSNSQKQSIEVETNSNETQTDVTVNGKQIPVPKNGSVHKKVETSNGNSDITVEHNSESSTNNSTSSSTHVEIMTESSNEVDEMR